MKRFVFVLFFSILFSSVFSQIKYVGFKIDSAVKAEIERRHIPGMQMAVIKYGVVIKKANYGFANLEDRIPVTDSTLFSIASMSKAFTCAGILLLMEEGKLSIDDPLNKYLDSLPATWNGITLRMLMNHTAGLRDDWDENDNFFYTNKTDSAFLSQLKNTPLKFQPGTALSYGCGPFVLGLVIAKSSGESYADFMKYRIFDKLGMTNTRIDDAEAIIPNRAAGYRMKDGQIAKGRQISAAAQSRGDVGVLTTLYDMQKWCAALQGGSLLQKSSLDLMFAPAVLSDSSRAAYGLGWFVSPYRDHALYAHGGGFRTGFNSIVELYPEDGVTIIILSNLFKAHTYQISKMIVGLFDEDYKPASQMDSVADPDTVRTLLLKSYYTELGLNVDTTRKMARTLHLPFYPESDADLAPYRNVEEFTFIRSIKPKKPKADIFGDTIQGIYLYRVKCKDQYPRYYAFLLNPSGKLVYLDYEE